MIIISRSSRTKSWLFEHPCDAILVELEDAALAVMIKRVAVVITLQLFASEAVYGPPAALSWQPAFPEAPAVNVPASDSHRGGRG